MWCRGADVSEDEHSERELALPSSSAHPRVMGCRFSLHLKPPCGMGESPIPWTTIRNPDKITIFPSVQGHRVSPPLNQDHIDIYSHSASLLPVFPSSHSSCSFCSSDQKDIPKEPEKKSTFNVWPREMAQK